MNVVILAAGDFPTHPVPLRALHEADFVIYCDSAYSQLTTQHSALTTDFVVIGDGDSLSESDKRNLGDRWIHVAEQDYNDLHKAMVWISDEFDHSSLKITILGATGKREDHTLGNISYLVTFAEEYPGIDIEMLTDHGRFVALHGTHTCPSFPKQQVSMFVLDPSTSLTSDGLRWPLQDFHPRTWWQASLNEALGNNFTLTSSNWVILFQTYEPKG